jgi:uncharacterized RmlC-like cupin family protein
MSDQTPNAIQTIRPDQRTTLPGPPNAPFVREQCYDDGHVWLGIVTTEPGAASPWHHHGQYDTFVYLLEGEAMVEYGEDGSERAAAKADGSMHIVPKGVVHREINTGTTKNRMIIMRVGEGPAVVPAADPTGE